MMETYLPPNGAWWWPSGVVAAAEPIDVNVASPSFCGGPVLHHLSSYREVWLALIRFASSEHKDAEADTEDQRQTCYRKWPAERRCHSTT